MLFILPMWYSPSYFTNLQSSNVMINKLIVLSETQLSLQVFFCDIKLPLNLRKYSLPLYTYKSHNGMVANFPEVF